MSGFSRVVRKFLLFAVCAFCIVSVVRYAFADSNHGVVLDDQWSEYCGEENCTSSEPAQYWQGTYPIGTQALSVFPTNIVGFGPAPNYEFIWYTYAGHWSQPNCAGRRVISPAGQVLWDFDDPNSLGGHTAYACWSNTLITLNHQSATTPGYPSTFYTYTIDNLSAVPQKTGKTFGGYFTGTNCTGTMTIDTNGTILSHPSSNQTWYACWVDPQVTMRNITYSCFTNASTWSPSSYVVGVGATVNTVPTKAHATFLGYCDNYNSSSHTFSGNCALTRTISTSANADVHYYAKFVCNQGYNDSGNAGCPTSNIDSACQGNTISITYSNGGCGTAPSSPNSCTYGGTLVLPSAPSNCSGHNFGGWLVNGHEYPAGTTISCDYSTLGVYSGTATITAQWTDGYYLISLNDNGGSGGGFTETCGTAAGGGVGIRGGSGDEKGETKGGTEGGGEKGGSSYTSGDGGNCSLIEYYGHNYQRAADTYTATQGGGTVVTALSSLPTRYGYDFQG